MTEEKKGGATHIVLVALLGIGALVAKNADSCFRAGAKVADDAVTVGAKSDGVVDGASTAARDRLGDASTARAGSVVPTRSGVPEGGHAVKEMDRTGWVTKGGGLTPDAVDLLTLQEEDDAALPVEEHGWHEQDGPLPDLAGNWCGLRLGGEGVEGGLVKIFTSDGPGKAKGTVHAIDPANGYVRHIEEVSEGTRSCFRVADSEEALTSAEWQCGGLVRLTDISSTVKYGEQHTSWVRCDVK